MSQHDLTVQKTDDKDFLVSNNQKAHNWLSLNVPEFKTASTPYIHIPEAERLQFLAHQAKKDKLTVSAYKGFYDWHGPDNVVENLWWQESGRPDYKGWLSVKWHEQTVKTDAGEIKTGVVYNIDHYATPFASDESLKEPCSVRGYWNGQIVLDKLVIVPVAGGDPHYVFADGVYGVDEEPLTDGDKMMQTTLWVVVKIKINHLASVEAGDVIDDCDYSFKSQTDGCTIFDTELEDQYDSCP